MLFLSKRCAGCHLARGQSSVGPALEELRRPQGAFELAGRLWNHVPAMFAALTREGTEWPRISPAEMGDLMAYLDATPGRDPPPDPLKGQVVLVRKECLKCHSLRGEGGRIGPDLAARRAEYASAAAWAAAMWTHTPRMAAVAAERGVLYPRFAGDEMGNLLGFLRSASGASPQ
ncbi:MAG: c-type cytochrome [candidate division NC10 bacterium]|nr:c-type cytochrome [candidate division NC10 bacterium]